MLPFHHPSPSSPPDSLVRAFLDLFALCFLRLSDLRLCSRVALCAIGTSTVAGCTGTRTFRASALADRLVSALHLFRLIARLSSLQVCQSPRLGMDIPNLLITLNVEISDLLARRRPHCLLEIRVETHPCLVCFVGDAVGGVDSPGFVGGLGLVIEIGQGSGESIADAVFVVQGDGILDGLV